MGIAVVDVVGELFVLLGPLGGGCGREGRRAGFRVNCALFRPCDRCHCTVQYSVNASSVPEYCTPPSSSTVPAPHDTSAHLASELWG